MVVACTQPPSAAAPEQAALLRLCTRPRAVAEISAHLRLPWTAVTLLLAELLAAGLVRVREPAIRSALPDPLLFDAVTQRLLEL
jgi:DNA-binding transcriptional ArsR family regulator